MTVLDLSTHLFTKGPVLTSAFEGAVARRGREGGRAVEFPVQPAVADAMKSFIDQSQRFGSCHNRKISECMEMYSHKVKVNHFGARPYG